MSPEPVLPALRGERTGSVLRLQSAATLAQERPKHVAPAVDKDESDSIYRDACRTGSATGRRRRPVTETCRMARVELPPCLDDLVLEAAEPREPLLPYWAEAREPLPCLIFLLPILLAYEVGVLWLGNGKANGIRNGADFWMRGWLEQAGAQAFILPVLLVGIFLGWHRYGKYPWRISRETLVGMFAESLLLAVVLLFVAQLQDMAFQCFFPSEVSIRESVAGERPLLAIDGKLGQRMISYLGAGVYEEVMFRLMLIPASLFVLTRAFKMPGKWAAVMSVFLTSLAFSVAHYVGSGGEAFSLFSFTFRTTAGCFFGAVFLLRGFGITVGCHALYDVMVGLLLSA
jgi:hypothetical protein